MRLAFLTSLCCALATPAMAQVVQGPVTSSGLYAFSANSTGDTTTPTDLGGRSYDVSAAKAASVLISDGRYAEADAMLTDSIARSANRQTRFLKAIASLGVGDAETAKRYFRTLVKMGHYRHVGAVSGLAIAEIRLGNADTARDLLQNLRSQQEKCGMDCSRAQSIQQAIGAVEKAFVS
ncbi:MAG: hypothetical protein A3H25_04800 [Sphingomonadales bacterium RIFCSPLOWO2_12_FULL_63_15]|nr:MAG: hypothetical protein A3H25_04800 [Sphingomonadales bacterium RIFCSPLOWO2_12_FULL_63_15]